MLVIVISVYFVIVLKRMIRLEKHFIVDILLTCLGKETKIALTNMDEWLEVWDGIFW